MQTKKKGKRNLRFSFRPKTAYTRLSECGKRKKDCTRGEGDMEQINVCDLFVIKAVVICFLFCLAFVCFYFFLT